MKFKLINSTLSCISKSIRFVLNMINKKIILGSLLLSFLGACASPTAMLGPAYTLSTSGSVLQAGLSYGSNEMITMYTGKTPFENIKEITMDDKNIHKQTLESEDFYILVKNKIDRAGAIFRNTNQ